MARLQLMGLRVFAGPAVIDAAKGWLPSFAGGEGGSVGQLVAIDAAGPRCGGRTRPRLKQLELSPVR